MLKLVDVSDARTFPRMYNHPKHYVYCVEGVIA